MMGVYLPTANHALIAQTEKHSGIRRTELREGGVYPVHAGCWFV
jgi:hypothetical protein